MSKHARSDEVVSRSIEGKELLLGQSRRCESSKKVSNEEKKSMDLWVARERDGIFRSREVKT
jgi:hypothetical protein